MEHHSWTTADRSLCVNPRPRAACTPVKLRSLSECAKLCRAEPRCGDAFPDTGLDGGEDEWGGAPGKLVDGDVLEIPSGDEILDHLSFLATDEASRPVDPLLLKAKLRCLVPGKAKWLSLATALGDSAKARWFKAATADAPQPVAIRFADDATPRLTLQIARCAGDVAIFTIAEETPRHDLLAAREGPDATGTPTGRRFVVKAFDSKDPSSAARCNCRAARLTCDVDDIFDDKATVTTLTQPTAPIGLVVRQWFDAEGAEDDAEAVALGEGGVLVVLRDDFATIVDAGAARGCFERTSTLSRVFGARSRVCQRTRIHSFFE